MATSNRIQELEREREDVRRLLASIGEMRPGSLVQRYRRCGKAGCHCADRDSPGHGPVWALTWALEGKTQTRVIPPGDAVEWTRAQIVEFRRFRELTQRLVRVSQELCDGRLDAGEAEAKATAKKGGSKRPSTQRSSPRSKRS